MNGSTSKPERIRPYTQKELATLYEVSPRCFRTLLKPFEEEIGKKKGWYFNLNQVVVIFDKLGLPNVFLNDSL